ncbi:MAG TPA: GNAT family N-acetyltransferase [Vicinamibacterales bacterium]|nr:GNAT family N-acetyltransferase [Vicinamibacterales bacterium]
MVELPSDILIRRAEARDVSALGELGAALMRVHYEFDALRFLEPGGGDQSGYAGFLSSQLDEDEAVVYVAERRGHIIGYVYAAVEPLSWKDLRDEAGFIHDLLVAADARRLGVGEALLDKAIEWLTERSMPRVVLGTAFKNDMAKRLFARRGFRPTMIEMTLEL